MRKVSVSLFSFPLIGILLLSSCSSPSSSEACASVRAAKPGIAWSGILSSSNPGDDSIQAALIELEKAETIFRALADKDGSYLKYVETTLSLKDDVEYGSNVYESYTNLTSRYTNDDYESFFDFCGLDIFAD